MRGTVSMARAQSPNSANSQFFIVFDDAEFLNRQYTVWGKVIEGMENIDKIKRGEPVRIPTRSSPCASSPTPPEESAAGGSTRRPPTPCPHKTIVLGLVAFLAGCALPVQAAVNAELARGIGSPLTATAISFSVGTVILISAVLMLRQPLPTVELIGAMPVYSFVAAA